VIGDGEVQPEQADDRADQPFGLPERQAEDGSQRQRRQDRQGRVVGLPAPGRTWLGLPRPDGFIGEPDCQAPALAKAGVVLTPVRYLALLPGNMRATVLVQLEGHAGHPGAGERSSCYSGSTCSATGRIRATTPRERLEELRTGDGRPLPVHLKAQIIRELDRLELVLTQLKTVAAERDALLKPATDEAASSPAMLVQLKGIGPETAAVLWSEGLFRRFDKRAFKIL